MIWPWQVSLIGTLRLRAVSSPQPWARYDRARGRMRSRFFSESLQHEHRHLREELAKVLQGGDPGPGHLAASRDAGQLPAQLLVQLRAEFALSFARPPVLVIPRDQDAHPGLGH